MHWAPARPRRDTPETLFRDNSEFITDSRSPRPNKVQRTRYIHKYQLIGFLRIFKVADSTPGGFPQFRPCRLRFHTIRWGITALVVTLAIGSHSSIIIGELLNKNERNFKSQPPPQTRFEGQKCRPHPGPARFPRRLARQTFPSRISDKYQHFLMEIARTERRCTIRSSTRQCKPILNISHGREEPCLKTDGRFYFSSQPSRI